MFVSQNEMQSRWKRLLTSGDKGHGSKDELHFDGGRWITAMGIFWLMVDEYFDDVWDEEEKEKTSGPRIKAISV